MCYICERNGTVGDHYRDALKTIRAALKVWGRKKPGTEAERQQASAMRTPKPDGGDWLKAPTRAEPWTEADFDKWQAAHRYTLLPENDTAAAHMREYVRLGGKSLRELDAA